MDCGLQTGCNAWTMVYIMDYGLQTWYKLEQNEDWESQSS